MSLYTPRRLSRCETLDVRGLRTNVRIWGRDDARPILFVHGTQDSSITFQFLVDALRGDWRVIAPDLRGHGHTAHDPHGYWFHDFLFDLDVIAEHHLPGVAFPLVGHSLGGNVGGIYAGVKPHRVSHFVSLDAFGPLTNRVPVDMRRLFASQMERVSRAPRVHADATALAERLMKRNHRLDAARALFLADESSRSVEGGRVWLFDSSYAASLADLHTVEEWGQVWSAIAAPTLWVQATDERAGAAYCSPGEMERRAAYVPNLRRVTMTETGHNLHHDRPAEVAGLIEDFLAST